jgi:hypothetical protein
MSRYKLSTLDKLSLKFSLNKLHLLLNGCQIASSAKLVYQSYLLVLSIYPLQSRLFERFRAQSQGLGCQPKLDTRRNPVWDHCLERFRGPNTVTSLPHFLAALLLL